MSNHTPGPKRRYPPELRERAVRMYFEAVDRAGERHGVVTRVAQQLGIGAESLRNWIRQAEVDRGSGAERPPRMPSAWPNWNAKCVNCGEPTRF